MELEIKDDMTDEEIQAYLEMLDSEQDEVDSEDDNSDFDESEDSIKEHEEYLKKLSTIPINERKKKKANKNVVDRQSKVFQIKNEYIKNSRTHDLFIDIDKSILRKIIENETSRLSNSMKVSKDRVYKKVEQCLNKKIPVLLKNAHAKFPQSFIKHPGFEFKAAEAYGGGKLWIEPNIPYYFDQFTEMAILIKYFSHLKPMMDKNVKNYHHYARQLLIKETKLATKFSKVDNLMDLLNFSIPFYYKYIELRDEIAKGIGQKKLDENETELYKQRYLK